MKLKMTNIFDDKINIFNGVCIRVALKNVNNKKGSFGVVKDRNREICTCEINDKNYKERQFLI